MGYKFNLTETAVENYFARRLGAPVTIRRMKPTFPGLSRQTLIIDAEVAGKSAGFALRLDYPWGGSCPFPLRQEWEVYHRLWQSQVPVAEPLWYDQNESFADGLPHMVRRLVDGSTSIPGLSDPSAEGAKLRQRVALECAEKLALVHTLDWQSVGLGNILPAPPTAGDALKAELQIYRKLWEKGRPGAYPLIEESLAWLEESIPADCPRISLTKGNNGVGEEIWRGEKIAAMSDWELASLSDGVLDLAFSQGTFTMGDFSTTMKHYEACVGHSVSPQRLAAGMFITWFKQIVLEAVYMYNHHIDGTDRRLQMLTFGLIYPQTTEHRLAACIGKDLVEAWRMFSNQEQSSYFRVETKK